ncbi:MAG: SMI1/KNR4 family protein [Armatimonadota bacterium]|nr:SMI1/KNR4 family protein [Armatimonadota bacterium]
MKQDRVSSLSSKENLFGTTSAALDETEQQLGFRFPPSFRAWLLENSGLSAGEVKIFPVPDVSRPWLKWDNIVQQFAEGQWFPEALEDDESDYCHLLPFAQGPENWYCFDYSRKREDGEVPVVYFPHDSGEYEDRASTFTEFLARLDAGEFERD